MTQKGLEPGDYMSRQTFQGTTSTYTLSQRPLVSTACHKVHDHDLRVRFLALSRRGRTDSVQVEGRAQGEDSHEAAFVTGVFRALGMAGTRTY